MIGIAILTASLMLVQYESSSPAASSYESNNNTSFDSAPFVQFHRKCFDQALGETKGAAQELRQQRYDSCQILHDAMVKHATAKLGTKDAGGVKRDLDRALRGVEKNYAKKMGVAAPRQVSACNPVGSPVLSMAPCTSVSPGVFWKTPKPPRTTARGARTIPGISVS